MSLKNKRIVPIKFKLILIFSSLIICCFLFQLFLSYKFLTDLIENKTTAYFQETISQASKRIDDSLVTYEKVTLNIIANPDIQDTLTKLLHDEPSNNQANYRIQDALAQITVSEENINSIQIIPKNSKTINYIFVSNYVNYNDIISLPWFQSVKDSDGQLLWLPTTATYKTMYKDEGTYVFSAVRKLKSMTTGEELGVIMINVDETHLRGIIEEVDLGEKGEVFLIGEDERIISCRDPKLVGTTLHLENVNRDKYILIDHQSPKTGWHFVGMVPKTEYTSQIKQFTGMFVYLSFIVLIIIVLIAIAVSGSIVKPIKTIIDGMTRVRKGDLDVQIEVKQRNELGVLTEYFNETVEELQYFIDKVYKQEISRQEAELKAIQAQINPHFLYNTLDTIYWMLIIKEEEDTAELVVALADMLRYSIGGKEFVTVSDEITQLENYLYIQKARFGEKLHFSMDIDDELFEYTMPRLLLQPLVENAIYHGFDKMRLEGHIQIIGKKTDDSNFYFKVKDDGLGISQLRIKEIMMGKGETTKNHTGLGIVGTDSRLRLIYGNEYGIEIKSQLDEGTEITLRLDQQ